MPAKRVGRDGVRVHERPPVTCVAFDPRRWTTLHTFLSGLLAAGMLAVVGFVVVLMPEISRGETLPPPVVAAAAIILGVVALGMLAAKKWWRPQCTIEITDASFVVHRIGQAKTEYSNRGWRELPSNDDLKIHCEQQDTTLTLPRRVYLSMASVMRPLHLLTLVLEPTRLRKRRVWILEVDDGALRCTRFTT